MQFWKVGDKIPLEMRRDVLGVRIFAHIAVNMEVKLKKQAIAFQYNNTSEDRI